MSTGGGRERMQRRMCGPGGCRFGWGPYMFTAPAERAGAVRLTGLAPGLGLGFGFLGLALASQVGAVGALKGLDIFDAAFLVADSIEFFACAAAMRGAFSFGSHNGVSNWFG